MCHKQGVKLISESAYGYMGYCSGCDRYNLIFENIFLLLSSEEVKGLGTIMDLEYGVYIMNTPIGRGKTISVQTPVPNTYFTFTPSEYEEFKRLVNETVLMLEVDEIIGSSGKK